MRIEEHIQRMCIGRREGEIREGGRDKGGRDKGGRERSIFNVCA